jgi:hypothetical protein
MLTKITEVKCLYLCKDCSFTKNAHMMLCCVPPEKEYVYVCTHVHVCLDTGELKKVLFVF